MIIGIAAGGFVLVAIVVVVAVVVCRRSKGGATAKHKAGGGNEGGLELGYNSNPMGQSGQGDGRLKGRPLSVAPTAARPTSAVKSSATSQLPAGWAEVPDAASGHYYYFNSQTGVTQWEPPV